MNISIKPWFLIILTRIHKSDTTKIIARILLINKIIIIKTPGGFEISALSKRNPPSRISTKIHHKILTGTLWYVFNSILAFMLNTKPDYGYLLSTKIQAERNPQKRINCESENEQIFFKAVGILFFILTCLSERDISGWLIDR